MQKNKVNTRKRNEKNNNINKDKQSAKTKKQLESRKKKVKGHMKNSYREEKCNMRLN